VAATVIDVDIFPPDAIQSRQVVDARKRA